MDSDTTLILGRITAALPKDLFTSVAENFDSAFHDAYRRALEIKDQYQPEFSEMLGRARHWMLERSLRDAGTVAGLCCAAQHTKPSGGRFTIIHCPEFVIGRAKVRGPSYNVPANRYRSELALLNSFISEKQRDFFIPPPIFSDDRIFGLFISGVNRHNPAVPAFVRFAVPSHDLKGWVFNQPIENVIAAYATPERTTEVIPDLANVTIKLWKT